MAIYYKLDDCTLNGFRETGTLKRNGGPGRLMKVRTVQVEENVLDMIEEDPSSSTRQIANTLNVSHWTVWKILKGNLLYPYHIQGVQALLPADYRPRIALCQWVLQTLVLILRFFSPMKPVSQEMQ